jgi:RimJ/RimL family protein N-acetyltransferase
VLARPRLLARMRRRSLALVDGLGALRVALALRGEALSLRAATLEDDARVWPWRNDPATRRFSRSDRQLTLDEHRAWWARALADRDRKLFLAQCGGRDVGVLRLDLEAGSCAEVSIYLDPVFTGLGLGAVILRSGQSWARSAGLKRLEAHILPGNAASIAVFESAGFERRQERWIWEAGP